MQLCEKSVKDSFLWMPQLNPDPSAQLWPHDLLWKLKTHMTSGYKKVPLLFWFCFADAIFDKQSNPLF